MDSPRSPDAARLLDLVCGSWRTQAAHVAARLGIADLLADGPRTFHEVAAATGAHPLAIRRLLRALSTLELCREREDGAFERTPLGSLLETDSPGSLRSWVIHWGGTSWPVWNHLHDSILSGRSARSLLAGSEGFEHLELDPEAAGNFHRAMAELTRLVAAELVRAVDWRGVQRIVDVAGGYGELLATVLKACPGTVGVLFDTPLAIDGARAHLSSAGLSHRCDFVSGDFFESIPANGDVYLLKSVLHDWDDERAGEILVGCRRAIPADGRLLVVERIMPERLGMSSDDQGVACSDLHMLVQLGGRERTEAELGALLSAARFRIARIEPLRSTLHLLEAVPDR